MLLSRLVGFLVLAALGCAPAPTVITPTTPGVAGPATSTADPSRWPREYVAGPGTGPALFLHQGNDAPALGYITQGVAFQIGGLPENGRVPIRIRDGLKVRAWMSTSRMAQIVQRRGKISGTAAYVGPGDLVRILGPAAEEDLMRVEVMPRFGDGVFGAAITGTFPVIGLSHTAPPADTESPSSGETRYAAAGQEIQLYDRPGGEIVATLPIITPPMRLEVLRERREWKGVRVGLGPYLIGYTNASLVEEGVVAVLAASDNDGLPLRLQAEADKPLWRIAEGTRVRFDGRTVAILDTAGWGREMNRYENTGEVDLFVAVDDQMAVRGMVRISDLLPVEGTESILEQGRPVSREESRRLIEAAEAPTPAP